MTTKTTTPSPPSTLPGGKPIDRALAAQAAMAVYISLSGSTWGSVLSDLMADLMLWANKTGRNMDEAVEFAQAEYESATNGRTA